MQSNPAHESSFPARSLKARMTHTASPAERVMSTSPAGTWLEGLRTSFEPEGRAKREGGQPGQGLFRRLRST